VLVKLALIFLPRWLASYRSNADLVFGPITPSNGPGSNPASRKRN
jgi:hypothetical protein